MQPRNQALFDLPAKGCRIHRAGNSAPETNVVQPCGLGFGGSGSGFRVAGSGNWFLGREV
jgi:hypothetical protein